MATKVSILGIVKGLCDTSSPENVARALDTYLSTALRRYSRDKPFETVVDVTGEAANLMTTPTGWVDQWSTIRKVVYPYTDEDSTTLEADAYEIDTIPVTGSPVEKIRFLSISPPVTSTVRVWFTAPHTCSGTTCTVYAQDVEAVAHLTASFLEAAKASYYGSLKDNVVLTDLVDYGVKSNEARSLSKMHLDSYRRALGLSEDGGSTPAAVSGDVDLDPNYYPASSHLTHHRGSWR